MPSLTPAPPMELLASVVTLAQRGFIVTDTYGDGVIRMAKRHQCGDESVAWVREDGLTRPPHLNSDYRACARRRMANDPTDPTIVNFF